MRLSISAGFLSAVADRFGMWSKENSTWGDWSSFVEYTQSLNPWVPNALIPTMASAATGAEIIFGLCLIIGFKTELFAKLSGLLLLTFALSMTFSLGIKAGFDYSVFIASAGAFALGLLKEKYLEIDSLIAKKNS